MRTIAIAAGLAAFCSVANAQIADGTWVKRGEKAGMILMVETSGAETRLTWKMQGGDGKPAAAPDMTLTTRLDGKDAPLLIGGKPSGETMAIRRVDANHTFTTIRYQDKLFGTSKMELSADRKLMTVENETPSSVAGQPPQKTMEYWDRK